MLKNISNIGQSHLLFWLVYIGYSHIYERIAYPDTQYLWQGLSLHYLSFVSVFYFTYFAINTFFKNKKHPNLSFIFLLISGFILVFLIHIFKDYYVFKIKTLSITNYILLIGEVFFICTFAVFFSIFEFTEALNHANISNLKLVNERNLAFNLTKKNKTKLVKWLDNILLESQTSEVMGDLKEFRELVQFLINNTHKALIPIDLEIENLKRYIQLYHTRSANFDTFKLKIEGNNPNWQIPHKSILTLLENTIKHGDLDETVSINISLETEFATIQIRNKIKSNPNRQTSNSIGLNNLKSRFELHLKGKYRIEITNFGGWFDVKILLS